METDARGQLGGLETTEEVRRRLARQSGSFRCPTCGRSNVDIIADSAKRCEESSSPPPDDVQVPAELSMGWRDEMGAQGKPGSDGSKPVDKSSGSARVDDSDGAELAEGFVQTVSGGHSNQLPSSSTNADASQRRREAADRAPTVAETPPPLAAAVRMHRVTNARHHGDGVPLWIDRAIVALVIALAALVLKVLFGI